MLVQSCNSKLCWEQGSHIDPLTAVNRMLGRFPRFETRTSETEGDEASKSIPSPTICACNMMHLLCRLTTCKTSSAHHILWSRLPEANNKLHEMQRKQCSQLLHESAHPHSRSSSALASSSDATVRGAAYRAAAHAHLFPQGQEQQLEPSSPPPVVSALRAVQAARPHTAAAAVHSLLPAMLLPERPRTVLPHTRTSSLKGKSNSSSPPHHHLW